MSEATRIRTADRKGARKAIQRLSFEFGQAAGVPNVSRAIRQTHDPHAAEPGSSAARSSLNLKKPVMNLKKCFSLLFFRRNVFI